MAQIVVYRDTPLDKERSVSISMDFKRYWVDPEECVSRAIGTRISREGCIFSMAEGFKLAGYTVYVGGRHGYGPYQPHFLPKLVYLLFGLAWIRGEWEQLERQLGYIKPEYRLKVLEHTAQHYISKAWFDQIRLQVP